MRRFFEAPVFGWFLSLILLVAMMFCSLACGGGLSGTGTGNALAEGGISGTGGVKTGTAKATVSGKVDDASAAVSKTSDGDYSIEVLDLDDGSEYEVIFSGKSFRVSLPKGKNVIFKVYKQDVLVLKRVLLLDSDVDDTLTADINALTHVQAEMFEKTHAESQANLKSTLEAVNAELFGKESVQESELTLENLAGNDPEFAVYVAIYKELVANSSSSSISALIDSVSSGFAATSRLSAVSTHVSVVNNITNSTFASSYATAFAKSQTSDSLDKFSYSTVQASISNTLILNQMNDDAVPTFSAAVDSLKTATMGVQFQYTFPSASILDARGISSYSGYFSTTPAGIFSASADQLTLQYIPSFSDSGKSFIYNLVASAGNGKSSTSSIQISVKDHEIVDYTMRKIGVSTANNGTYYPVLGPVSSGDHIGLVSEYGSSNYRLEIYAKSDIVSSSSEDYSFTSYSIPSAFGAPEGLLVYGSNAYVCSANTGVVHFDLSSSTDTVAHSSEVLMADQVVVINGSLFGLHSGNQTVYKGATDLSSVSVISGSGTLGQKAQDVMASKMGTSGESIFIAGTTASGFYTPATDSFLGDLVNLTISHVPVRSTDAGDAMIAMFGSSQAYTIQLSDAAYLSTLSGLSLPDQIQSTVANGTTAFSVMNVSQVGSFSLNGAQSSFQSKDTSTMPIQYGNIHSGLHLFLINEPLGFNSSQTGAWLLAPGQFSSTETLSASQNKLENSWVLKVYKIKPTN